ncbi:hypothetical protein [Cellulomonas fimi]|uniref:Uncharacterized protein n=1 Tax=Cellulomonas fimi (strain ATCC 484 / DSM 20113 / JCM 1341 / CCUG 24087 / LMG 16345 / NBRC 15513 / NCIMB 8980 / NCTC 7547 / NRS-133) TaxID=590998 RepID=F4H2H1_CELFA|nr:hypothetical protein [Cellulomonas fimi]AEE47591.1 hypothetical protein Celf_3479 [Cellulomonas fimi ATCC 484]NNH08797.1 hypothetical protein [Cellulomonas fimi]VEH36598.1 Internalin-A precursor [Cellulomonas fimi]
MNEWQEEALQLTAIDRQAELAARQASELVITKPWSSEMAEAIRAGRVTRVVCNYALGFDEPTLDFLRDLPVRELVVLDRRLPSLDAIYTLAPTLELLEITTDPGISLDLLRLPRLQTISADWAQVANTIMALADLRSAAFGAYQPHDLSPLAPLSELTTLSMKDRPRLRSLAGLDALPRLADLGIYLAAELRDISQLRGRATIERLELEACRRLDSTLALEGCTGLRTLSLAEGGQMDTLAPVGELVRLEELYLHGSTRFLDGDLTPIAGLPRLQELRMQNRRHYRPTVAEITAQLPRAA